MHILVSAPFVVANLAYVVTAAALLVRDILWLRVLAALANTGFLVGALLTPGGPNYVFLGWSLVFLAINIVQIVYLILERRDVGLSDRDRDLHLAVFPNLPVGEFRLLLRSGRRREASPGEVFAQQGQASGEVLLVEEGVICLERDGRPLDRLRRGDMLGEIAFVAGRPFSSRAFAETTTQVVAWERNALDRLFLRRPSLALGFHAAFIGQLRRTDPADTRRDEL